MEDNQRSASGLPDTHETLSLISEKMGQTFQQAVWYDRETKLYYELLRFNRTDNIAVFIGPELTKYSIMSHGGKDESSPCSVDDDHPQASYHRFKIRRSEPWHDLKALLPSYLGRAMLCD